MVYLKDQIKEGRLLLSGPSFNPKIGEQETRKEATLVFRVEDEETLLQLIKLDPYWTEGLVAEFQITEWNPMFGMLGASADQIEEHLAKK
ncbi:YciI family protein [Flavobacterium sp. ZT3R17]|uniref:YciI family protein n=1 Tax=Flavobacterium cryoconiti TaxID=3398736 RepID=UPI003A836F59